jgi:HSP20 family molecular chaperone IbpA
MHTHHTQHSSDILLRGAALFAVREGEVFSSENKSNWFSSEILSIAKNKPPAPWQPSVDIAERGMEFIIKVTLSGVRNDEIRVLLDGGILSIFARRKLNRNEGSRAIKVDESGYESFRRSFTVPETTLREKVSADYKDEVLTVHLPKDPAGKIRLIKVDF